MLVKLTCQAKAQHSLIRPLGHPPPNEDSQRNPQIKDYWSRAEEKFERKIFPASFGHHCDICDRLWWKSDLILLRQAIRDLLILERHFSRKEVSNLNHACKACYINLRQSKLLEYATDNGFRYPEEPANLPELNHITKHSISPCLDFKTILYKVVMYTDKMIRVTIINIPMDDDQTVTRLPRSLDDELLINASCFERSSNTTIVYTDHVRKAALKTLAWSVGRFAFIQTV